MSTSLDFRLLNDFQRDFPLVVAPFAAVGQQLGVAEEEVIAALARLQAAGGVSRVGPVFAPGRIGASTLAAVAVPAAQLERVASLISARPEVNHNYLREHRYNLWFVATAPDRARLGTALEDIGREAGCQVISLPLVDEYHIDLGFDLSGGANRHGFGRPPGSEKTVSLSLSPPPLSPRGRGEPLESLRDLHGRHLAEYVPREGGPCALPLFQDRLVAALQGGLDIVPRPFARVAEATGLSEAVALAMIADMRDSGIIKRFGVVVRHHELGYRANAMCVWDVPDEEVSALGALLAAEPAVTLCYRRQRALPGWRYNLFCMIHGREREEVESQRVALARRHGLDAYPHEILFSLRRFKQCGARYAASADTKVAACG
ncbi:MAG: Lrp/AsnC family transcriptional regulator [Rhodocyclaceae bacterium]|nr:Lrp/AsnC family transcriptional regulator [Rhodocyclaceae bacterium]